MADHKKSDGKAVSFPPRVQGMNGFETDKTLQNFLERVDPEFLERRKDLLSEIGAFALGELDSQAEESDRHFPATIEQKVTDPVYPEQRRGHVILNARYKAAQQQLYKWGTLADCFDKNTPESHMLPFITQYMTGKSDISTGCPYAMTHPVALVIEKLAPPAVKKRFLPELLRTDGNTPIGGTWATERHSGSDVGATETKAFVDGHGNAVLQGLKWFTSAIGFDRFLTVATARPDREEDKTGKGLGLYLVPSHIDEDWSVPNDYNVRHLKNKLGTKALPTGETELTDTVAFQIVPPPHGLKAMMIALGCSRVHNAMSAAGVMHRAYLESVSWATNRKTFGDALITRPMVQKRILDIHTEWQAGSALAFESARAFSDLAAEKPDASEEWTRILTALAKYKTAEQALWCCEKSLELVGGNGYTEEYPVARQFRDAMVLRVWEGPEQIQALELMRMVTGKGKGDFEYIDRLEKIIHELPYSMNPEKMKLGKLVDEINMELGQLRREPEAAALTADEFLSKMSNILAYGLLCEQAGWDIETHQDHGKKLTAQHFFDRSFTARTGIQFDMTPLHKHFKAVVKGEPIPAHSCFKRPTRRP